MNDEWVVRVGSDRYEDALAAPHARLMDFTGRPIKGFVYVRSQGLRDRVESEPLHTGEMVECRL